MQENHVTGQLGRLAKCPSLHKQTISNKATNCQTLIQTACARAWWMLWPWVMDSVGVLKTKVLVWRLLKEKIGSNGLDLILIDLGLA